MPGDAGRLRGSVDSGAAQLALKRAEDAFNLQVTRAQLLQLVGQVECRQYRHAVDRGHSAGPPDLAHFGIQEPGCSHQRLAPVGTDADRVFTVQDADADRLAVGAHVCCSSDLSLAIMASTRERACSFLASSCERSPAACSCCWRRPWFSASSWRTRSTSSSIRAARVRSLSIWSRLSMGAR